MMWILLLLALVAAPPTQGFCPPGCSCSDVALSVDCSTAGNLRVVPIFLNPQITSLSLAKNKITEIAMSLQFYSELRTLDVSQNAIETLGMRNFENLEALETLNCSYNVLKEVENGAFTGLGSLTWLDLQGSQIELIHREVFWPLNSILGINLDKNRLEFLDWDLFRGLDSLQTLSIRFNFVQALDPSPSETLWTLRSLRTLDLSSNQLTRIKNSSLANFPALSTLNLCCNYIHTLEDGSFTSLGAESINLSNNRLSKIPSEALSVLGGSLKGLDLSSNRFSDEIPPNSFKNLTQMRNLAISDAPSVTLIDPAALEDNSALEVVSADHLSSLTSLDASLLRNKPNLSVFSVKFAQIRSIPIDFFQPGELLIKSLQIEGNPLDCNCSALPLFEFLLRAQHLPPPDFPPNSTSSRTLLLNAARSLGGSQCFEPEGHRGILLRDLKRSDFDGCLGSKSLGGLRSVFSPEGDPFQLMVILIGAALITLVLLVVGVKLCCILRCGKCHCFKCPRCPKSEKEEDCYEKPGKLFNGLAPPPLRELPRPPINPPPSPYNDLSYGGLSKPPTRLFYAPPNGNSNGNGVLSYFPQEELLDNYHHFHRGRNTLQLQDSTPPPAAYFPSQYANNTMKPTTILHYGEFNRGNYPTASLHRAKHGPGSVLV